MKGRGVCGVKGGEVVSRGVLVFITYEKGEGWGGGLFCSEVSGK